MGQMFPSVPVEKTTPTEEKAQQPETPSPSSETVVRPPKRPTLPSDEKSRVARKFFLHKDVDEALRYKAYIDRSKNFSEHVEAALRIYLADELEKI